MIGNPCISKILGREGDIVVSASGNLPAPIVMKSLSEALKLTVSELNNDWLVIPENTEIGLSLEEMCECLAVFVTDTFPVLHRERLVSQLRHEMVNDKLAVSFSEFIRKRSLAIAKVLDRNSNFVPNRDR